MPIYRDVGVVLRTYKLGEADRIVVLCTKGRGKVRAVAKGVRKTPSRVGLQVDACVECGETEGLVALDLEAGGLRCRAHRDGLALSSQAVSILQLILGGRLAAALGLPVGPATFEVDHLASAAMERHLDR